jgi:hypothetical protein
MTCDHVEHLGLRVATFGRHDVERLGDRRQQVHALHSTKRDRNDFVELVGPRTDGLCAQARTSHTRRAPDRDDGMTGLERRAESSELAAAADQRDAKC